MFIIS
jgi:hypothetical protein